VLLSTEMQRHNSWHEKTILYSSPSLKLHVKYFENGDRYYDWVNRSRIENHPRAIDRHYER